MRGCTAMPNPFADDSAETLVEAGHAGDSITHLAHQNLIGKVDEQPVFEHSGNIVDRLLQTAGITDATVQFEIQNQIALIGHDGSGFALSHPQLRNPTHSLKLPVSYTHLTLPTSV